MEIELEDGIEIKFQIGIAKQIMEEHGIEIKSQNGNRGRRWNRNPKLLREKRKQRKRNNMMMKNKSMTQ